MVEPFDADPLMVAPFAALPLGACVFVIVGLLAFAGFVGGFAAAVAATASATTSAPRIVSRRIVSSTPSCFSQPPCPAAKTVSTSLSGAYRSCRIGTLVKSCSAITALTLAFQLTARRLDTSNYVRGGYTLAVPWPMRIGIALSLAV